MAEFPIKRLRRLRRTAGLRSLMRETIVSVDDLIYPLFIVAGTSVRKEVSSMPGVFNLSVDQAVEEARELVDLGLKAIILFGIPEKKDDEGSGAWINDGIVQQAARAIKQAAPELLIIADTCLCEYTAHGHCGPLDDGEVDNDRTLELLERTAVSQAHAGCDVIAPSGMIDGMVLAIRDALDEADYTDIPILSYAVKYASAFYGPFRDAAQSSPAFGDRRAHQMDPPNLREAVREAEADVEEGADILMVKPALPYLDVLALLRAEFDLPLAAYQVSGEYAMIQAAARNGWIDLDRIMNETLIAIKRAGADLILTYFAKRFAQQAK
jgi:porphobilinogen synthase